jgi:SAM-dependent methyltransferase
MSADRPTEAAEVAFFDRYYRDQVYHPVANRLRHAREVHWVRRLIRGKNACRVLSLGCGAGEFELMLAPNVERVVGIDISPAAIEAAREAARARGIANVEFHCQSLADLKSAEPFDLAACISFLHHLPAGELPAFLERVRACLAPGGLICTQDPNRRGALRWLGRQVLRRSYDSYHSPDERELDPRELGFQLRAAGFVDVRLGSLDHTLIPAMFLLPRGPAWPFHALRAIDFIWNATPLWRWAGGFTATGRKP